MNRRRSRWVRSFCRRCLREPRDKSHGDKQPNATVDQPGRGLPMFNLERLNNQRRGSSTPPRRLPGSEGARRGPNELTTIEDDRGKGAETDARPYSGASAGLKSHPNES